MSKYSSAYYFANRDRIRGQKRRAGVRYRKLHPGNRNTSEYMRVYHLKYEYGLTLAQYDQLLEKQSGLCAICGTDIRGKATNGDLKAHVDHCHKTKLVRGLLCMLCNTRTGILETWAYKTKAEMYLAMILQVRMLI